MNKEQTKRWNKLRDGGYGSLSERQSLCDMFELEDRVKTLTERVNNLECPQDECTEPEWELENYLQKLPSTYYMYGKWRELTIKKRNHHHYECWYSKQVKYTGLTLLEALEKLYNWWDGSDGDDVPAEEYCSKPKTEVERLVRSMIEKYEVSCFGYV